MYLKLGKCHFRKWQRDQTSSDLLSALNSYKSAMKDPRVSRAALPTHYFEMISILLRMGHHQSALDILSCVTTLYKADTAWVHVSYYNMAQILLVVGRPVQALELYRMLLLFSGGQQDLAVDAGPDHIVQLSLNISTILLMLEAARVTSIGDSALGSTLFSEAWDKMSTRLVGGLSLRFNKASFQEWFQDPLTFKRLAEMLTGTECNNFVMAAEFYGVAADRMRSAGTATTEAAAELSLRRAELLSELCVSGAELYAQQCSQTPRCPAVLLLRAARCLRTDSPLNRRLLATAQRLQQAVETIQRGVRRHRGHAAARRHKQQQRAASRIGAFIRMCLARNQSISLRLAAATPSRMPGLLNSLRHGAMRSGRVLLVDHAALWAASATRIQTFVAQQLARKRVKKFRLGVLGLQRLFRGQRQRRALRRLVKDWRFGPPLPSLVSPQQRRPGPGGATLAVDSRCEGFGVCGMSSRSSGTANLSRDPVAGRLPLLSTSGCALLEVGIGALRRGGKRLQWLPFGLLPDESVAALLQGATDLCLASPSLRAADCRRLQRLAGETPLRSLSLAGAGPTAAGLAALLRLGGGVRRWTALSLAGSDCLSPRLAELLGERLRDVLAESMVFDPRSMCLRQSAAHRDVSSLLRLHIEDEPLADRGAAALAKHLQGNSSLQQLALLRCGLGTRAAAAAARLVSTHPALVHINLSANALDRDACCLLVTAVSNRGNTGPLRTLTLQFQRPPLDAAAADHCFALGRRLGVRVDGSVGGLRAAVGRDEDQSLSETAAVIMRDRFRDSGGVSKPLPQLIKAVLL